MQRVRPCAAIKNKRQVSGRGKASAPTEDIMRRGTQRFGIPSMIPRQHCKGALTAIAAAAMLTGSGARPVIAAPYVHAWEFDSAADVQYDPATIEIADGIARLRPQLLPTGHAMQLNVFNSPQRAEIADSAQSGLDLGVDDFLFVTWVKLRSGITHAVFQKRGLVNGSMVGVLVQIEKVDGGHRLRASFAVPGGGADIGSAVLIRDTGWNQIALAVDRTRGRAQFYLNGKPFEGFRSIAGLSGSLANPGAFRIGYDDTLARLIGDIDEAAFWRYEGGLPADVDAIVRSHYDGVISDTGNLVSAWRFNDSTGADSAGSNHLTLVNNPSFLQAGIYRVAEDGPYLEVPCASEVGGDLYAADHVPSEAPRQAELRYQVSGNGSDWWYFDTQTGWRLAASITATQASLLHHLKENLADAPIRTGAFCFRAFFVSDGRTGLGLDRFEILPPPAEVSFVAQPAAGRPVPSRFRVIFETDLPAEAYIEYRAAASAPQGSWLATPVTTGGTVFGIDVTDLDAGSDYQYRVRMRPRGVATAFATSAAETIPVTPIVDTPATLEFAVWGDSRPVLGEALQPQVFYRLMEKIAGERTAFHIAVGDNVNLTGAQPFNEEIAIDFYRGWRYAYDIAGGSGYMFFALGNHDEDLPEPLRSIAVTARLRATVQPMTGDALQRYYSWRWGDALFVVMDGSAANPKAGQVNWVLQTIQQPARWKFVFNHYPFFNSDRGIANAAVRDQLHAAFVAAGVNVVFQAHDHWYADTVVDGIHYTTSGGAGSPLRPEDLRFSPISEHHYLRVQLVPNSVTVNAIQVNEDGTNGPVLDRYCVPASDAPAIDTDGDGDTDACDPDDDGDGIPDVNDINGTAGADHLTGTSGNDTINGEAGADTMRGLAGDDTYIVENSGDAAVESAAEGTDTVQASVSYTLPADVEKLILTGNVAIDGTGNLLSNTLTGNGAANVLDGKAGADILIGNGGDDTYHVDDSGDRVIEEPAQGIDKVLSIVSFALPVNVENLTLSGSGSIDGEGNSLVNRLLGNAAGNTLDGGPGSDVMTGKAGADRFLFKTTLGSTNVDRITDFTPGQDSIRLENAVFTALSSTGTLAASAFRAGSAASTAAHRIIYHRGTGHVYYDRDGNGPAPKVRFATLTTKPALTRSDFVVQ
jgi:Ca2+-binding RTX toxin-like protein